MRYATPEAFRTALEDRLKHAQNEQVGLSRLRKRVVFERLLARLTAHAADEWVLKGGFALELRLDELSRSTKDIDVDWRLGEEDATEILLDARVDAVRLRATLDTLFAERATHPVPSKLPPPPQNWADTWSKLAANLPIPPTLTDGYEAAATFLDPTLTGTVTNDTWEPEVGWRSS